MSATKNCPSPIGIIMVLFAANLNQKTTQTPLERLQAKIAVVSVGSLTPLQVSSTIPPRSTTSTRHRWAETVFFSSRQTYFCTFVTDLPHDTISDKGTWALNGDTVDFKSDEDVTWRSKRAERQYVLVRRTGRDGEILAVGLDGS
jgi:hypothetical protein